MKSFQLIFVFLCITNISNAYASLSVKDFVMKSDTPSTMLGRSTEFDKFINQDKNRGIVMTISWSDLQKTKDGQIESNNVIDQAIQMIHKWNKSKNKNDWMFLKLRVFASLESPPWLKHKIRSVGGRYNYNNHKIIPYYKRKLFKKVWKNFQHKLTKYYHDEIVLLDVSLSKCMIENSHAIKKNYKLKNTTSMQELNDKGLRIDAEEICLVS